MQRSNNFLAEVQINGQLEVDSPPPKLLVSDINVDISYNFKSNGYLTTEESDFNTLKGYYWQMPVVRMEFCFGYQVAVNQLF